MNYKFHRLLFFIILLPFCAFGQVVHLFYVDAVKGKDSNPGTSLNEAFKTIERAQKAVREAKQTNHNDICVFLRKGEYKLNSPLIFENSDGGTDCYRVIYKAYNHEDVLISGGFRVGGWKLFDRKKNIYVAVLPPDISSRQLFVNGLRAVRARSIGNEKHRIVADSTGHITSDLSMLGWKNPSNVECVYREIWTNPRCGIASIKQINDTSLRISMKQPGWRNCRNKGITSTRTPWYFENAFELLDEEGEWYLDKTGAVSGIAGAIYYKPRPFEDMKSAEVIIPLSEKLIILKGTSAGNPVRNIQFSGLKFSYTTWLRPESNRGHSDAQNNVIRENKTGEGESLPDGAALSMKYAHNILVDGCTFTHLGGAGINMYAGCRNNQVQNSLFYDLSGTGIQMGDYINWQNTESENSYLPANASYVLKGNKVTGNHIENCGVDYRSATAIAAAFPVDLLVNGNTVMNMPYSGLHIGWGWTTFPETVMKNNRISHNFIQNVMLELADGGSVYTLGGNTEQQWSYIHDNYMDRVMWGQCVYMDNGSSFYKITDNVYKDGDDYNVKINSGSHDIDVKGIYSNKKKDLIGKSGCYNYHIDSTQIFSPENVNTVDRIYKNAGSPLFRNGVWAAFSDINHYEAENAQLTGGIYATSGIGTHIFGYSGMGFLSGFDRNLSSTVSFRIKVSASATSRLSLCYSTTDTWNDGVDISVNNRSAGQLSFVPVKPDEWVRTSKIIHLKKGENTIAFVIKNPDRRKLYLDYLELIPTGD